VTYMELLQIIYTILILGGTLLVIVIAFSYLLSKSKSRIRKKAVDGIHYTEAPRRISAKIIYEQSVNRKDTPVPVLVYPIDPGVNNDSKIQRKSPVTLKEVFGSKKQFSTPQRKTGGYGKRYTIINEEMKKSYKPNVINF